MKEQLKVYEISYSAYLLKNINYRDVLEKFSKFVDSSFSGNQTLLTMHDKKEYKKYNFNSPYPTEPDKVYKKDKIYKIQIRTIDPLLAKFFMEKMVDHKDEFFKGIKADIRVLPRNYIEKLYSITPALMKREGGYWKNHMTFDKFEEEFNANAMKKYQFFTGEKIEEESPFYYSITMQEKAMSFNYKDTLFLGDKLELMIKEDALSQDIAYMSLGVGIMENNTRGCGFMGYRWI